MRGEARLPDQVQEAIEQNAIQARRLAGAKRNRLEAFFREEETWTELALPMLRQKLERERAKLEHAKPEELPLLQATIRILRGLIEDPARFIDVGPQ
jgi:hypothetical protein